MTIKLLKVGAAWCPPCRAADRAQTFEKFGKKHPEVVIEVHDDSEVGDEPAWMKFADKWNVKNLPTVIWLSGTEELFRSSDVSSRGLEKQYERAARAEAKR